MRIAMIRSVAGPGFSYRCGEVADVPAALAEDLVSAGHARRADRVEEARKPAAGERATHPAATRKRRS